LPGSAADSPREGDLIKNPWEASMPVHEADDAAALDWISALARQVFARLEVLRDYVGRDVDPTLLLECMAVEDEIREQRGFGPRA
jgi:hypothetical protein